MLTFERQDSTIISANKVLTTLKCDIKKLTKAVAENNIDLIILPKNAFSMGIRFPKNHRVSIFDRAGEDPLHIEVNNFDGFIPTKISNEKILLTLNWKTAEPYTVIRTNSKNNLIKEYTPYTLALKEVAHAGSCDAYCPCGIDDLRRAYMYQIFYFINLYSHNTQISLDEIFLIDSDVRKIAAYFYEKTTINLSDTGGYQEKPWSKKLIKDINAIHHHFKRSDKITSFPDKKIVQILVQKHLSENYKNKEITSNCFAQIPKIVTDCQTKKIDFKPFLVEEIEDLIGTRGISEKLAIETLIKEKKTRNSKNASDLIVLLDIIAEKNYIGKKEAEELKKKKLKEEMKKAKTTPKNAQNTTNVARYNAYTHFEKIKEKLISAGIKNGALQQAIFSIINHTFSEIKHKR